MECFSTSNGGLVMDEGMNDEEARAFQGYFVRGTVVFFATAVVAHLLVWSWRPWY